MIDLREFLKKGFLEAVGRKPDYQIRLEAADWLKSGVLIEADLEEINTKIEGQYSVTTEETPETKNE